MGYISTFCGRKLVSPSVAAATLLLDESGLGSAAAAYSTRLLRAAYTGDCMRVRRSSDNAECDVEFLNGWLSLSSPINDLSAGSGSTLTAWAGSDSCYVVTFYDQSGNARNLTQATAANQPRIVNAGALDIGANSRPVVYHDGSGDSMLASYTRAQPVSISLVFKTRTFDVAKYILDGGVVNSAVLRQESSDPDLTLFAGSGVACLNSGLATNVYGQALAIFNGASSKLSINNGTDSTGNPGSATTAGVNVGGATGYTIYSATLNWHELVVWPSVLGATERSTAFENQDAAFVLP